MDEVIGFSMIGTEQDSVDELHKPEIPKWRPTLAFATQRVCPLNKLFVLCEDEYTETFNSVKEDARLLAPDVLIERIPASFRDIYSFDECYNTLFKLLKSVRDSNSGEILVGTNTGTHAMKFALVLMVEKGLVSSTKLVHLLRGNTSEALDNYTVSAKLNTLHTGPYASTAYRHDLEAARTRSTSILSPTPISSSKFLEQMQWLNSVGTETNDPILLLGDTGTGKTTVAERIHALWKRRHGIAEDDESRSLVSLNCAGYSGDTAYSRLFGHLKGSFSGAHITREGAIAKADKGTLFLDEIGELSLGAQAMLLKAIETGDYSRFGDTDTIHSDFRLICATNTDLAYSVSRGTFRHDLLARISTWVFKLPSLRDRLDDLPDCIQFELDKWNESALKDGSGKVSFDESALAQFIDFAQSSKALWCDNFRDLSKSVRRLATRASIEAYRDAGVISRKIVDAECAHLLDSWKFHENEQKGYADLQLSMKELFKDIVRDECTEPLTLVIEKSLMETALEILGSKAAASKLLYGNRSNPTAHFNHRWKLINRSAM